jgi:glucose-fructose oxidoreductase
MVGSRGTLSSYDYEPTVRLQTEARPAGEDVPVDTIPPESQGPIAYVIDALKRGKKVDGPLSPRIARIGQQIVDSAVRSARLRRTVRLLD